MNKNKLSYRGVVYFYIPQKDGSRKLIATHNAGTLALAKLFAYALIGDNTSEMAPYQLNVYDKAGAPVLVHDKLLTSKHVESNYQDLRAFNEDRPYLNHRACFECVIERPNIRAASAVKAEKVVLLDKKGIVLASIQLHENFTGEDFAEIFEYNENLVIVWQMELIYDYLIEEIPDEYQ